MALIQSALDCNTLVTTCLPLLDLCTALHIVWSQLGICAEADPVYLRCCVYLCCCVCPQTYHYHLDTGKCHDPLRMRYSHHCKRSIDLDAMRAGAALLIGTHDFTQFSNESKERLKRNPVKTLERLDVVQEGPTAVRLEVCMR